MLNGNANQPCQDWGGLVVIAAPTVWHTLIYGTARRLMVEPRTRLGMASSTQAHDDNGTVQLSLAHLL